VSKFRKNIPLNESRSFDRFHWAQTVIDAEHRLVHEGLLYSSDPIATGVANNGSADYLMTVPEGVFPHVRVAKWSSSDGPGQVYVYEETVVSANGTEENTFNRNRNSSNNSASQLYRGPTISTLGTLISTAFIPAVSSGFFAGAAAVFGDDPGEEWVLKPGSNYLFRFTNTSGGAVTINLTLSWYELNGYGRN
jgi:hypothetical protein